MGIKQALRRFVFRMSLLYEIEARYKEWEALAEQLSKRTHYEWEAVPIMEAASELEDFYREMKYWWMPMPEWNGCKPWM